MNRLLLAAAVLFGTTAAIAVDEAVDVNQSPASQGGDVMQKAKHHHHKGLRGKIVAPTAEGTLKSVRASLHVAKSSSGKHLVLHVGKKRVAAKAVKIISGHRRKVVLAAFKLKNHHRVIIKGSLIGGRFYYGSVFIKGPHKGSKLENTVSDLSATDYLADLEQDYAAVEGSDDTNMLAVDAASGDLDLGDLESTIEDDAALVAIDTQVDESVLAGADAESLNDADLADLAAQSAYGVDVDALRKHSGKHAHAKYVGGIFLGKHCHKKQHNHAKVAGEEAESSDDSATALAD